jgi:DNA-binding beta-propeller fold protein YncE
LLVVSLTIIPYNGLLNYSGILAQEQGQFKELQYSFVKKWDSQGIENGQFNQPHSIDVDSLGNVYVADSGNSRVQKFTSDGQFITKWGSEGTKDGQFIGLHDVAADSSGKFVYTVELGNKLADKIANNRDELQDVIFAQGFGPIVDIEVGPDGYLYVLSLYEAKDKCNPNTPYSDCFLFDAKGVDGSIFRIVPKNK